jgi:nucleoside-diphosphate-sugar epimerase
MRIVVAGGAGFIGSYLCRALLDRGDEVIVLDNFATSVRENTDDLMDRERFRLLEHNITEKRSISGDIDVVVHLASPASPKDFMEIPAEIMTVNSVGTQRLIDLSREKHARFILGSTGDICGESSVHVHSEHCCSYVDQNSSRGMYSEAKRFAEAVSLLHHRQYGVDVGILRNFNTYGPGMRDDDGRAVSNFIIQALEGKPLTVHGDGSQSRGFCYIDDQVRAHVAMIDASTTGPINVGNPDEFTMMQLAEMVVELTDSKSEIITTGVASDDPARRCPDISGARNQLGWEPKVELREGLSATVEYFRNRLGVS